MTGPEWVKRKRQINKFYCKQIINVHRLTASNVAERKYV